MPHKNLSLIVAALGLTLAVDVNAAPIISPFAADLASGQYSADLTYPGTSAQAAFNGGVWNAGSYGKHWIQADMGTSQTLSKVVITAAVAPATNAQYWIYLSNAAIGNSYNSLTPVATFSDWIGTSGFGSHFETHEVEFAAASGRYLQIVAYAGSSWTALGDQKPRVDWVQPVSQVPLPPASLLMLSGLLYTMRRRFFGSATI